MLTPDIMPSRSKVGGNCVGFVVEGACAKACDREDE